MGGGGKSSRDRGGWGPIAFTEPLDVLLSMTASLMERQPKAFDPVYGIVGDKQHTLRVGGKPPREVFYRNTETFMTPMPPPMAPKLCTARFMCQEVRRGGQGGQGGQGAQGAQGGQKGGEGAPATVVCYSCAVYAPGRAAYYCQACFDARHPWYRSPHISRPIEVDEGVEHTLKSSHNRAEANRYAAEGVQVLDRLRQEKPKLAYVADDEKIDAQLGTYGRELLKFEKSVLSLRANLQQDLASGDTLRRGSLRGSPIPQITEQVSPLQKQQQKQQQGRGQEQKQQGVLAPQRGVLGQQQQQGTQGTQGTLKTHSGVAPKLGLIPPAGSRSSNISSDSKLSDGEPFAGLE
ncbi:hypothetical protein B484DRAFT_414693, partial [Ochromonadaceae sp. CCMP2298]